MVPAQALAITVHPPMALMVQAQAQEPLEVVTMTIRNKVEHMENHKTKRFE